MHASMVQWWNSISLRTRITGVTVLLLTIGLVISGFGTMLVLRDYLIQDLDHKLDHRLSSVTMATAETDSGSALTDYVFARLDDSGALIDQPNAQWRADPPVLKGATAAFVESHQGTAFTVRNAANTVAYRMEVKRVGGESVALGLSLDSANRSIARLFTIFFLFGIVVVILSAALTRLLVGSTLGPLRHVERTAAAIADGDFGQRLGNTTPNTEVGRLNRSLNQMLNRIDRALADRARTIDQMRRFVGDASHELRTPLVSVRGYAELYRMGALQSTEDVAQAMDRIEREAIRLGALVSDLLALARLDETRPLRPKPVELLPVAHDAALDARALAPKRTIRVVGQTPAATGPIEVLRPLTPHVSDADQYPSATTTAARLFRRGAAGDSGGATGATASLRLASARLLRSRRRDRQEDVQTSADATQVDLRSDAVLPLVSAEEDKLRQVLTNLIGNAIRFTPDDSPIEIAAYAESAKRIAVLEVIDHGEGIAPQVRDKIFERFWRADSSRTRDTGGSGLGLAIVAAIVAAHQGTVGISETPGGGATFRVTLPLLTNDRPSEDIHSQVTDPPQPVPTS